MQRDLEVWASMDSSISSLEDDCHSVVADSNAPFSAIAPSHLATGEAQSAWDLDGPVCYEGFVRVGYVEFEVCVSSTRVGHV